MFSMSSNGCSSSDQEAVFTGCVEMIGMKVHHGFKSPSAKIVQRLEQL